MDKNSIVLLLDPDDEAGSTASALMYRHLLDDVLGGSAKPLPFPVLRPAVRNDPDLLLRLIEDLRKRYGSVLVVAPEPGSQRRPPIDLPANIDWLSFADQSRDVLALLRRDLAPSRGSLGPLSTTYSDPPPTKGGGFGLPASPVGADSPRAPSSSQTVGGEKVFTGVSVPPSARPGRTFVASLAAYTEDHREHVFQTLKTEAPRSPPRLDLDKCLWLPGARVRVDLRADGCVVSPPSQTFSWDGTWEILRFDVELDEDYDDETLTLRFDVAVEGMSVRRLRPQIEIRLAPQSTPPARFAEQRVPGSAFASYASKDLQPVLERVSSLKAHTKMDIFLDRTHIPPGEVWEDVFPREIRKRDELWLFWSRSADASDWVGKEWRLALAEGKPVEPHPLEPQRLAPPPPELEHLQFGALFEDYLTRLREEVASAG